MKNKGICFIDIETTGLDEDAEIIEIALIKVGYFSTQVYKTKIRPLFPSKIHPKAREINGYSEEKWKNAPMPAAVANDIAKFCASCTFVGHNVTFDIKFLKKFLKTYSDFNPNKIISHRNICTMMLAHEHLSPLGLKSLSLDSIRKYLGWTIRKHHDAYNDALDCKRLYDTLIRCSKRKRVSIYLKHLGREIWKTRAKEKRVSV